MQSPLAARPSECMGGGCAWRLLHCQYPHGQHVPGAGPSSRYSVLDKLVPAYYHRLDEDGSICGSAFGANTAGRAQDLASRGP